MQSVGSDSPLMTAVGTKKQMSEMKDPARYYSPMSKTALTRSRSGKKGKNYLYL